MKASAASAAPKQPELQCSFVKCPPGQVCETGMCKVRESPHSPCPRPAECRRCKYGYGPLYPRHCRQRHPYCDSLPVIRAASAIARNRTMTVRVAGAMQPAP